MQITTAAYMYTTRSWWLEFAAEEGEGEGEGEGEEEEEGEEEAEGEEGEEKEEESAASGWNCMLLNISALRGEKCPLL
jgi:hypothetical protein